MFRKLVSVVILAVVVLGVWKLTGGDASSLVDAILKVLNTGANWFVQACHAIGHFFSGAGSAAPAA